MTESERKSNLTGGGPSTQDFQFIAGSLVLDFINTVGNRKGKPREYLSDARRLKEWVSLAGFVSGPAIPLLTSQQLASIRRIRQDLYRLFHPFVCGRSPTPRRLARFNTSFNRLVSQRQLQLKEGKISWSWSTRSQDSDRILGPILWDAVELLASGNWRNLRECEDKSCGWLFIDRSHARRRRWCSMRDCGNRAKVRAFYGRQRKGLKSWKRKRPADRP